MVRYELKKIFGTWGGKIALLLLAAVVVLGCWNTTVDYGWVNEQGVREPGHASAVKLRNAKLAWAGDLDTEHLTAALQELHRIHATPEAQSQDYKQNDIAFGWRQGLTDIREVINKFFCSSLRGGYDYNRAERVSADSLPGLYGHRVQLLKDYLDGDGHFSAAEREYLVAQYEALDTPMYYTYFDGWWLTCQMSIFIAMMVALILGYLVSGIFSNEFKWKADSVYFSAALGRTSSTRAKIRAGFYLVTAVYWVCMLLFSLFTLCYFGISGWNCPIQLDLWRSIYNINYLELFLLIAFGGYLGNLFTAFLSMWISAKTKTAVISVTMPFVICFLPSFLENLEIFEKLRNGPSGKIFGLLPDRLLQVYNIITNLDVYSVGRLVVGAIPVLFVVYIILTAGLVPAVYRQFRRKEIL